MTITKSGSLASFYTVNKTPIKHLRVYFSPKQAGEGDPSPENIRPIEGWDNIQFAHSGKNLFPFKKTLIGPLSSWLNGTNMWWVKNELVDVFLKGRTVTFSAEFDTTGVTDDNNRCGVKLWSRNQDGTWGILGREGTYISKGSIGRSKITQTYTNYKENEFGATLPAGAITSKPMVELGSTMTEYEPYKGSMQTIDWSNNIGTIGGGSIDLITGELVEDWRLYTAKNENKTWYKQSGYLYLSGEKWPVPYTAQKPQYNWCSHWQQTNNSTWSSSVAASSNMFVIGAQFINQISDIDYANSTRQQVSDVINNYLQQQENNGTPLQIAWALKTPITYQLTPTQLQTFIGKNNIWSNADRVEVEYDLAESNDELYRRRNIILQGAPHLQSASGNIAHFNTDLAAPIKECKIYFNPVQGGEGTPSPENIRPISGWTGCKIVQAPENIIQSFEGTSKATLSNITTYGFTMTSTVSSYNTSVPGSWENGYIRINIDKTNVNGYIHMYAKVKQLTNPLNVNYVRVAPHGTNSLGTDLTISNGIVDTTFSFPSGNTSYLEFKNCGATIEVSDLMFTIPSNDITNNITFNNTIYGGYIDLITGKLIQTYKKINLKDYTWGYYTGNQFYYTIVDKSKTSNILFCNMLPISNTNGYPTIDKTLGIYSNGASYANIVFIHYLDTYNDRTVFNTWLQSLDGEPYIIYELATPIEYQLTPQQLTALKGVNNIWSDANGPIEIQYWTH